MARSPFPNGNLTLAFLPMEGGWRIRAWCSLRIIRIMIICCVPTRCQCCICIMCLYTKCFWFICLYIILLILALTFFFSPLSLDTLPQLQWVLLAESDDFALFLGQAGRTVIQGQKDPLWQRTENRKYSHCSSHCSASLSSESRLSYSDIPFRWLLSIFHKAVKMLIVWKLNSWVCGSRQPLNGILQ